MQLHNDDCLKVLATIPDNSIDLILTDPPYGTTPINWDSAIDFNKMWFELKRIVKKDSAIVLFGIEPFSSKLRLSNLEWFKYDWIWNKDRGANFLQMKYAPFKVHEIISVFSNGAISYSGGTSIKYNPQMDVGKPYKTKGKDKARKTGPTLRQPLKPTALDNKGTRYPKSVINFKKDSSNYHPTQKPIALLEFLIKSYSNENDLVLDFTMGSGSTGVACKNLNRDFIGIELDEKYFEIAKQRIYENNNTVFAKTATSSYSRATR